MKENKNQHFASSKIDFSKIQEIKVTDFKRKEYKPSSPKSSRKPSIKLGEEFFIALALGTIGVLYVVSWFTKDKIQAEKLRENAKALLSLFVILFLIYKIPKDPELYDVFLNQWKGLLMDLLSFPFHETDANDTDPQTFWLPATEINKQLHHQRKESFFDSKHGLNDKKVEEITLRIFDYIDKNSDCQVDFFNNPLMDFLASLIKGTLNSQAGFAIAKLVKEENFTSAKEALIALKKKIKVTLKDPKKQPENFTFILFDERFVLPRKFAVGLNNMILEIVEKQLELYIEKRAKSAPSKIWVEDSKSLNIIAKRIKGLSVITLEKDLAPHDFIPGTSPEDFISCISDYTAYKGKIIFDGSLILLLYFFEKLDWNRVIGRTKVRGRSDHIIEACFLNRRGEPITSNSLREARRELSKILDKPISSCRNVPKNRILIDAILETDDKKFMMKDGELIEL